MTFDQIAWLPLCAALTAAGVAFAFFAFRRRGAAAGLRATALGAAAAGGLSDRAR